jgi:hypothetical protein
MAWTVTVEVALATQPMAASPTWTDISAYVMPPISITLGRGDEFSQAQPATMSLRLKNFDGRFTMGNVAGAYYPNVKVGKRIRVKVARSAVTYFRFDGHVNGWPTTWMAPGGALAVCEITATDRMKRLGRPGDLRSMLEEEILRDAPEAYYPLSDPDGSPSASSITGSPQGPAVAAQLGVGGELSFGGGTGPGTDSLAAPSFQPASATDGLYLDAGLLTPVGSVSGVSLAVWFATSDAAVGRTICSLRTVLGGELRLVINGAGKLQAFNFSPAVDPSAREYDFASTTSYNDDHTHQAVLTESLSGSTVTWRVYVDGAQWASGTYSAPVLQTYVRLLLGTDHVGQLWAGTISHAAVYPTALSAARIATQYAAGVGTLVERTDQRIGRVADYVNIPAADRAFDAGNGTVGAQATSGKQPLEAMQENTATESGVLFIAGNGQLTFHNRSRRYNQAPAFTLPATEIGDVAAFPGDDFGVTNDMTVTRAGGSTARSVNQPSIDEYGLYRDSAEIVAASDEAAQSAASWRVNTYGTPRTRIPNVTVEVAKLELLDPTLVAPVLATTIGTKVRLGSLPANAPASTVDLFVEGWAEQLDVNTWAIAWNTSPGDVADLWQLGVAGRSELGITTRLAQAGAGTPVGGLYADVYADAY